MSKFYSYPRTLVAIAIYPVWVAIIAGLGILVFSFSRHRSWHDKIVEIWSKVSCWLFGIQVQVSGLEHIPKDRGCVCLFNHTSLVDIIVVQSVLPQLRFGAKIELFRIPIFGRAMRRAGALPIARGNVEEVIRVYRNAKDRIVSGESFILAPEGTRQREENLAPFKAGPFIFAIEAQAPLVPIILTGASLVLHKGSILPNWGVWKRVVTMQILPPIETQSKILDNRNELKEQAFSLMQAAHQKGLRAYPQLPDHIQSPHLH